MNELLFALVGFIFGMFVMHISRPYCCKLQPEDID